MVIRHRPDRDRTHGMRDLLIVLGLLLLVCLATMAHAEDFVCGDSTRVTRYIESVDPSKVTDPTCTKVSKVETPSQRVLLATLATHPGHQCPTLRCYVKVVGGLAAEMNQTEKDAVDAALAAQAATQQSYADEVATQDLCNPSSLAQINSRITTVHDNLETTINNGRDTMQTTIDAVTNLAQAKTALTTLNTGVAAGLRQVNDTYAQAVQKIVRCLYAHRFVR